ncbi:MAG: tyrosine-type recombinase/integrase [Clostridia bacterium]
MAMSPWHAAVHDYEGYLEYEVGLTPSSVRNYVGTLHGPIARFLGTECPQVLDAPGALCSHHVLRFFDWAHHRGWKGSTINHHLAIWRVFVRWMVYDGGWGVEWNVLDLAGPVRYRTPEAAVWTLDEAQRFLEAVARLSDRPVHDAALFTLFLSTGLRLFEALSLAWPDIEWSAGRIRVRGKGQKERFVPLVERAAACLRAYQQASPHASGPVFLGPEGSPVGRDYVMDRFQRFAGAAGLHRQGLTLHKLRHTALTLLMDAGLDVYMVKEVAGHSSLSTTGRYLHVSTVELVKRYRAVCPF